ncbi:MULTISPECIES: transcription antitermination factor NusB [Micrococcaceae]|uniref:Transcription antitermination protein NusB n=2 Tax=Pseudoglutamicibacter albus TaxID=98671 RepID=A0A095ZQN2_9MICC|nr:MULTISPECIES: transcription antitermination factor NusB [Micrococcaceae]KGF20822.1 antitermination protein NusB [Pseudoglutamicibacter albus DNF00011]MCG7304220.1 transcription antitermination factor NusB [Pseudoglutamicibacter albus]MDR7293532.1 N utilization substance protein B [Pseudoglutamicibacter albus]OFT22277.1 N utilization substance protein B [Arthrobacter sp. HMSC08H08]OFT41164.1 N utilization substance protein B [Arthrobacter sp. HMSC06H05]
MTRQGESTRSKARRRALEILFEAEQRGIEAADVLQRRDEDGAAVNPYTRELVGGVSTHTTQLDEVLTTYAQGWTLDRMPAVDRAALRIGLWELLYNDEIPDAVAVDEAVRLVREMSTSESPDFVNGLLGRLQRIKPTLIL